MRPMTVRVAVCLLSILAGVPLLRAQQQPPRTASDQAYGHAVNLFNTGHIADARDVLATLLAKDPAFFMAYPVYWDIIARNSSEQARRVQAGTDLKYLESVPDAQKTEDYYSALEYGLQLTGQADRAKLARSEGIQRYPRGWAAQQEMMDAARAEKDPARQVAGLRAYMSQFPGNVSWTEAAAHDIYLTMAFHPDRFSAADRESAAAEWDRREEAFVRTFGNPNRRLMSLETIAGDLVSADPAAALEYCRKGEAFVETEWPETAEFTESARREFWPAMLEAYAGLKRWPEAVRTGAALEALFDANTFLSAPGDAPKQAAARAAYSTAIEATGDVTAALRQMGLAAALDGNLKPSLEAFERRHPMPAPVLEKMQADWAAFATHLRRSGDDADRRALLASEENTPATELGLRDLAGHKISLEQFRGKPLILDFWATWCGPCRFELNELNRLLPGLTRTAGVLAVSVDRDKDSVAPFAAKSGYRFPVALSSGLGESAYGTTSIPQLYVLDANGNIRFHLHGYEDDGLFGQRIEWMLNALAAAPPSSAAPPSARAR